MLKSLKQTIHKMIPRSKKQGIELRWIRQHDHAWLQKSLKGTSIKPEQTPYSSRIETLASATNALGPQPLWNGYGKNNIGGMTRTPNAVRTAEAMGNLYTHLLQAMRPNVVVEFGTAFGVSGMYFLAGIEWSGHGRLLTFEPNNTWRELAVRNLSEIGTRFHSTHGTFEENIDKVLQHGETIDIAFIDAIHTSEFVLPQLEIVLARCSQRAIIILDDISFSDDMRQCWKTVSTDKRFACSVELGRRVGIVEYNPSLA